MLHLLLKFPFKNLFLIIFLLISMSALAQKPKKIDIINSELIQKNEPKYGQKILLTGSVKLHHNGAVLDADSVFLDQVNNLFIARSNVRLVIGDTVTLTSKKLEYDANTQKAIASGNVILRDKSQTLETDKLYYDRNTNIAYYNTKSKITQQGNVIFSNYGLYNLNTRTTKFEKNVALESTESYIYSDDVTFHNNTGMAEVNGPTTIVSRKDPNTKIYTEKGVHYTKTKESYLYKNSKVYYDGKILTGDKLYFNQATGFGKGEGNVKIDDPKENRYLKSEYGEVFQFKDSAMVSGKPYMVKHFKKDTLYIAATKLTAARNKEKKSTIRAYDQGRFYKKDIQGKADSIVFKETIGEMHFYRKPVFWSGNRQITSDTVIAFVNTKNQKMDSLKFYGNAFAISKADSLNAIEFNQIKGNYLLALLQNDKIHYVKVEGNAQAMLFVDDEDKEKKTKERIGINKSDCGYIEADFLEDKVQLISCKIKGNSKTYPEKMIPESSRYLRDFAWLTKERVFKWQDIFIKYPEGNLADFTPAVLELAADAKPKNIKVKGKKENPNKTDENTRKRNTGIQLPSGTGSQSTRTMQNENTQ